MDIGRSGFVHEGRLSSMYRTPRAPTQLTRQRLVMAGNRGSLCSPKVDAGNLGIGEGQLSGSYPERQSPAMTRHWGMSLDSRH